MICSITSVDETKISFTFQIFDTQGKKRKTFFDTGKQLEAKEDLVWRLTHRKDFETEREAKDIRRGQVIRVRLQNEISDSTGFVSKVENDMVTIKYMTGIAGGRIVQFNLTSVITVHEILSSPLFYRQNHLFKNSEVE